MKLLVATRNINKLTEIRAILDFPTLQLVSMADFPRIPDVEENGATFRENALCKALHASSATGLWVMADDSGLEVHSLGGAPGVHSARFAGRHGDDSANNSHLLELLQNHSDRTAQFRCVIALASPQGCIGTVEGTCHGTILQHPRGTAGFGYDPLFVPQNSRLTFAEMTPAEKNLHSHRAHALQRAKIAWKKHFS